MTGPGLTTALLVVLATAVVASGLTGCTSGSARPTQPASASALVSGRSAGSPSGAADQSGSTGAVALATITGRFLQIGGGQPRTGPAPAPRPLPGTVGAYVDSTGAGSPVATSSTDSQGRFSLTVPAGRYYLFGLSPYFNDGKGPMAGGRVAVARTGAPTAVDVIVAVP